MTSHLKISSLLSHFFSIFLLLLFSAHTVLWQRSLPCVTGQVWSLWASYLKSTFVNIRHRWARITVLVVLGTESWRCCSLEFVALLCHGNVPFTWVVFLFCCLTLLALVAMEVEWLWLCWSSVLKGLNSKNNSIRTQNLKESIMKGLNTFDLPMTGKVVQTSINCINSKQHVMYIKADGIGWQRPREKNPWIKGEV